MNYKHLLFLLTIIILLNSCEDDTICCPMPEPEVAFESGIFVLNEGNFGSANASVSFVNIDNQENRSQIFKNINGFSLGDTAQSIEMYEDIAVIVVNVSNKLEIVNRYTFQSLGTIETNLMNPRFAEIVGDKLYVTNWGDGTNPNDDFVAVFSLNDFSFLESIPVAEGPEKLVSSGTSLYVAHKGGYSFNNIVSVIDTESYMLEEEIQVGDVPNSILITGNNLWVLSSGKPAYAEEETAGEISKIDIGTNKLIESVEFPATGLHPENLNLSVNNAYFTIGKSVFKYILGEALPTTAEFELEEVSVLYGLEIKDNLLYVASPNTDFTGDGKLYIYDLSNGQLIDEYSTGINPNGIYFN